MMMDQGSSNPTDPEEDEADDAKSTLGHQRFITTTTTATATTTATTSDAASSECQITFVNRRSGEVVVVWDDSINNNSSNNNNNNNNNNNYNVIAEKEKDGRDGREGMKTSSELLPHQQSHRLSAGSYVLKFIPGSKLLAFDSRGSILNPTPYIVSKDDSLVFQPEVRGSVTIQLNNVDLSGSDVEIAEIRSFDIVKEMCQERFSSRRGTAATYYKGRLWIKQLTNVHPIACLDAVSLVFGTLVDGYDSTEHAIVEVPDVDIWGGDVHTQNVENSEEATRVVIEWVKSGKADSALYNPSNGSVCLKKLLKTSPRRRGGVIAFIAGNINDPTEYPLDTAVELKDIDLDGGDCDNFVCDRMAVACQRVYEKLFKGENACTCYEQRVYIKKFANVKPKLRHGSISLVFGRTVPSFASPTHRIVQVFNVDLHGGDVGAHHNVNSLEEAHKLIIEWTESGKADAGVYNAAAKSIWFKIFIKTIPRPAHGVVSFMSGLKVDTEVP